MMVDQVRVYRSVYLSVYRNGIQGSYTVYTVFRPLPLNSSSYNYFLGARAQALMDKLLKPGEGDTLQPVITSFAAHAWP